MKTKRIKVVGTGSQAPYGIGEIINDYPDTDAGLKKAMRAAAHWYNPASIIGADGSYIELDWSIIRDIDRGYVTQ